MNRIKREQSLIRYRTTAAFGCVVVISLNLIDYNVVGAVF